MEPGEWLSCSNCRPGCPAAGPLSLAHREEPHLASGALAGWSGRGTDRLHRMRAQQEARMWI